MNRISSCGKELIAETMIEATGNISRGIAIFRTIALLRMIERVPVENVSVKKCTPTSAANMWIAKFGTYLCSPSTRPITKKYMQNRTSGCT